MPVLLLQPGRVLHGARRRPARPGDVGVRSALRGRLGAPTGARFDSRARPRADRAPGQDLAEGAPPRARRGGDRRRRPRRARPRRAAGARGPLRAGDLPGPDTTRLGAGPAVPVHLGAHSQPVRARPRPRHGRGALRPRQGARRVAAIPRGRIPRPRAPARAGDRPLPGLALPRDGGRRARRLSGHAGRRFRALRRRGRPARGRRARAAAAALRRRGPARGVAVDLARDAGAAPGGRGGRGRPGLRDPRASRPRRSRPADRARPAGAAVRAVARRDAAPACPGEAARRSLRRDPARGHPRPPAVRVVRGELRGVRPCGRAGSGRDRDEDGRLPDEWGQPARAGADRVRRGGQAERLPRRAEGALRRAPQHRVVAGPGEGGRARRLRLPRPEGARQDDARRPPRRKDDFAATSTSARATTTPSPPAPTRISACSSRIPRSQPMSRRSSTT